MRGQTHGYAAASRFALLCTRLRCAIRDVYSPRWLRDDGSRQRSCSSQPSTPSFRLAAAAETRRERDPRGALRTPPPPALKPDADSRLVSAIRMWQRGCLPVVSGVASVADPGCGADLTRVVPRPGEDRVAREAVGASTERTGPQKQSVAPTHGQQQVRPSTDPSHPAIRCKEWHICGASCVEGKGVGVFDFGLRWARGLRCRVPVLQPEQRVAAPRMLISKPRKRLSIARSSGPQTRYAISDIELARAGFRTTETMEATKATEERRKRNCAAPVS
eukprot:1781134-Rhodomonas_salina.1